MSLDMSEFLPHGMPHDWVPATYDNLDRVTLTFHAGGETVVREFASPTAALHLVPLVLPGFDYSPLANAVLLRGGEVILLPVEDSPRERVDHTRCRIVGSGHNPHWGPALRAANGPAEDWVPVEVVEVSGTAITLSTPSGRQVVHHHAAEFLEDGMEYNERWRMLRGPLTSTGRRTAMWVSRTPITPCTA